MCSLWTAVATPMLQRLNLLKALLAQLPHSTPGFGFMKAHKGLVFKEELWKPI